MPNSRIVLITGASRGIGRAIALRFAAEGDTVVVNYRANHAAAEDTLHRCRLTSPESIAYAADVSDPAEATQLVQAVLDRFERIDVLVNNAGISLQKQVQDTTDAEWQDVVNANLGAAFYVTKAALPAMIARKSGKIVNISSMWGLTGASCEAAYSAAKAGLIGWTKALAKEVGPSGIHVNCVAPGLIDTEMNANLSDADRRAIIDETPLCRIGTPQDVADAVLFFASPQASFITGEVLRVDGGLTV